MWLIFPPLNLMWLLHIMLLVYVQCTLCILMNIFCELLLLLKNDISPLPEMYETWRTKVLKKWGWLKENDFCWYFSIACYGMYVLVMIFVPLISHNDQFPAHPIIYVYKEWDNISFVVCDADATEMNATQHISWMARQQPSFILHTVRVHQNPTHKGNFFLPSHIKTIIVDFVFGV